MDSLLSQHSKTSLDRPFPLRRGDITREALEWVGTPYRYLQCVKGEAADCVNLPWGVARELGIVLPKMPYYSAQWAWHQKHEMLLQTLDTWGIEEKPLSERLAGDLLAMRIMPGRPCAHLAILVDDDWIVHAINGDEEKRNTIRRVVRQKLHGRRLAQTEKCYVFPGVEP